MDRPLDVLAIMAHPDDAELLVGGALLRSADLGERTGILDLSAGEMGSRGSPAVRAREAEAAGRVLGLSVRECAGLPDAGIRNGRRERRVVVEFLRRWRPRVVVTHWIRGRHPDHGATAALVRDALFLSGLRRWPEDPEGEAPAPHRPTQLVHALTFRPDAPRPSFVVDITEQIDRKVRAIECYRSQIEGVSGLGELRAAGDRPLTDQVRAHAAVTGALIGVRSAEAFWSRGTIAAPSLGAVPAHD